MTARVVLAAALVAACYGPSANPGAPCSAEGSCPTGQECRSGWCFAIGAPHDAEEQLIDESVVDTATEPDALDIDASTYVPWGTPVELNSLETTGGGETDPCFTTDRLTVVLAADTAMNDADIYIGTRAALTDTFTTSVLTVVSAVGFDDESPELSADGKTLWFTSYRSGSGEVYISTYTTSWSAPVIATDLSSTSSDGDVAISPDGLTAAVVREGGQNHVYIYTRATLTDPFSGATVHDELNITTDMTAPTITNGGDVIYLHAGNPRDLYRAQLKGNGTYTTPVPVAELNTPAVRDAAPFVVESDDYMMFERAGDIFETSRTLP